MMVRKLGVFFFVVQLRNGVEIRWGVCLMHLGGLAKVVGVYLVWGLGID